MPRHWIIDFFYKCKKEYRIGIHSNKFWNFHLGRKSQLSLASRLPGVGLFHQTLKQIRFPKPRSANTTLFQSPFRLQMRLISTGQEQITPPHPTLRSFLNMLGWRFKVLFMRRSRPWTVDEFLALGSWLFLGNSMFLLFGTTSFVSLILWAANGLQFQGMILIDFVDS
jgi:hypothetical protein